jgi:hypothetical protein
MKIEFREGVMDAAVPRDCSGKAYAGWDAVCNCTVGISHKQVCTSGARTMQALQPDKSKPSPRRVFLLNMCALGCEYSAQKAVAASQHTTEGQPTVVLWIALSNGLP